MVCTFTSPPRMTPAPVMTSTAAARPILNLMGRIIFPWK
jgi:hypothetical protein